MASEDGKGAGEGASGEAARRPGPPLAADIRFDGDPALGAGFAVGGFIGPGLAVRGGERLAQGEDLQTIRERAANEVAQLPEPLKALDATSTYDVSLSEGLKALIEATDQRFG